MDLYSLPSICLKIEVSNNYCILVTAYVHNKWISKYIRTTNNVCFYKRTKGFAAVLRKSSACPDFCNKRQKISVIRLTHFLLKKHWIPKLCSICVHLPRNIDQTSPTYSQVNTLHKFWVFGFILYTFDRSLWVENQDER